MKKTIFAIGFSVAIQAGAFAQTFTASSGYSSSLLFNDGGGFTISGVSADSAGNVFYIESGNFGGTPDTRLFKRTAAGNFATQTQLFSYNAATSGSGAGTFGSFVRVLGTTVYFGENTNGTIRSVSTSGSSAALIATVVDNYDLAFSGTTAFLSANPTFADNKVFKLNLSTGVTSAVFDTGGDFSGPITIDSSGDLLYGATKVDLGGGVFGGIGGGIYKFTAASVQQALTSGTALTISNGTLIYNNGNNAYLGLTDDSHLYSLNNPSGKPATTTRFDLGNVSLNQSVGLTGTGQFFGASDVRGTSLYVAVTSDFSTGPSAVFRVSPVPEPSALALLATVFAAVSGACFFKRKK